MTIPTNILHVELVNLISAKYLSQIWICVTIFFEHSYIRQKRFPKPIKEVRLCQFVEQNLRAFLVALAFWHVHFGKTLSQGIAWTLGIQ